MKVKEKKQISIVLHTGFEEVGKKQIESLKPLEEKYEIIWLLRWLRHPTAYDSYSELVNKAVIDSPNERVFLLNDRTNPKPHELEHIDYLLDNGYAMATKYSVGFMGFDKELFRTIGYFDENFYGGGSEDDDIVLRLRIANLAYFESCEADYDYSWKSPLFPQDGAKCSRSGVHFWNKWKNYSNAMVKIMPEPEYPHYDSLIGPPRHDIRSSWKDWSHSVIGLGFGRLPQQGDSRTYHFMKNGVEFKSVIDSTKD